MNKIIGNKVVLRPITLKDTSNIVKWRNNPSVKKNFIFRETFTAEIHNNWINTQVKSGKVVQYIILEKSTNTPVGSVYFRDVDKVNNSAEFGIFIGEDSARGKGLGGEATKLFVNFGFNNLNLHRISLRLLKGNDVAYKAYAAAGFKKEGVFKDMVFLDGKYCDIIFMSVLKK